MTALVHTITADEAAHLRGLYENGYLPLIGSEPSKAEDLARLWRPIEAVEQESSRAHCRLCSGQIVKGERCIRFGFDPYDQVRGVHWGKLSAAYLHLTCPEEEGT